VSLSIYTYTYMCTWGHRAHTLRISRTHIYTHAQTHTHPHIHNYAHTRMSRLTSALENVKHICMYIYVYISKERVVHVCRRTYQASNAICVHIYDGALVQREMILVNSSHASNAIRLHVSASASAEPDTKWEGLTKSPHASHVMCTYARAQALSSMYMGWSYQHEPTCWMICVHVW
jgi:hypothetical protein